MSETERNKDVVARLTRELFNDGGNLDIVYELLAEDRQLTLRREGVASVEGNRLMLHRAIANLLSNALKHAAAGSEVRVRLAEADGVCRVTSWLPSASVWRRCRACMQRPSVRIQSCRRGAASMGWLRACSRSSAGAVENSTVPLPSTMWKAISG